MAIECDECGYEVWCIMYNDQWICKRCFLDNGGEYEDWEYMNEEAKRERRANEW